jgi:hypothetical protein
VKRLLVLLTFILPSNSTVASPNNVAVNSAAEAFYEYEGWNSIMNNYLKSYERDFTKEQMELASYGYWVANAVFKRRIEFTYRFP